MLSFQYIQNGLLFIKPSHVNGQVFSIHSFLESLKESLSHTLVHFYPLAGQLVIQTDDDQHECRIYVDCNKGPGAWFSHASALDITVSDILSPNDVPLVVRSFFYYNEATVNYDGHTKPLLSVQVTELLDGVFIACSINHVVADGTSYWHFWNVWSEIHRAKGQQISVSRLPVHNRWFPDGCALPIPLPFTHQDEFIKRFEAPELREKVFHFSSESIANVRAKANDESKTDTISSFQALSALVWRSMVRANILPRDQILYNYMYASNRHRLNPPLPQNYFGACITGITTKTTAGELLENSLGWAASLLHQSVVNLTDKFIRDFVKEWLESPYCYHLEDLHDYNTIAIEHSPRFDMYGNEFGLGKPVAVRNGPANKAVGVVIAYPGYEGGGSVDLEICLPPDSMRALETDDEFMAAVSSPKFYN
uniref:HXXXD-type acyl-transferase family protein n=2 Tax=Chenopodium quinoa TaxID=63459 RepID=A0A803MJ00_CHEQI